VNALANVALTIAALVTFAAAAALAPRTLRSARARGWSATDLVTFVVPAVAAAMSFDALSDFACDLRAYQGLACKGVPIALDGAIFVAAEAKIRREADNADRSGLAALVYFGGIAITVVANMGHTAYALTGQTWPGPLTFVAAIAVAAVPPLAFPLSFAIWGQERKARAEKAAVAGKAAEEARLREERRAASPRAPLPRRTPAKDLREGQETVALPADTTTATAKAAGGEAAGQPRLRAVPAAKDAREDHAAVPMREDVSVEDLPEADDGLEGADAARAIYRAWVDQGGADDARGLVRAIAAKVQRTPRAVQAAIRDQRQDVDEALSSPT